MLGFCFCFFAMIEMPNVMNGLLKSMTRSRSLVIVIGAMAKSACCINTESTQINTFMVKLLVHPPTVASLCYNMNNDKNPKQ